MLKRAVEMDQKKQYTMALVLYEEGVQMLLNIVKEPLMKRYRVEGSTQEGTLYC